MSEYSQLSPGYCVAEKTYLSFAVYEFPIPKTHEHNKTAVDMRHSVWGGALRSSRQPERSPCLVL